MFLPVIFFMKFCLTCSIKVFCSCCFAFVASAQVTLKIVSLPKQLTSSDSFFFAGSINKWNPADSLFLFKTGPDSLPYLTIPESKSTVEFKITRGGWNRTETDSFGNDIGNRSFHFTGSPQTITLKIYGWKNEAKSISTASSNVKIIADSFPMPQLGCKRRIWLYLPPDYTSTSKHYPVMYMQDGQNLFDNATAFSGEWQVDETLNKLHSEGDYGVIVVGIDNGGEHRINEYSPWYNTLYGGGQGDAYIDFIKHALKPFIDANFRTLSGPQNTCIFGSSLGAFVALYGGVKFPEIFGKVGSFSPAYWFSLNQLSHFILNNPANIKGMRILHQGGLNESKTMATHMNVVNNHLLLKGLPASNNKVQIDPDGTHTELYWRREFGTAYQWLFAETLKPVR